MPAYSSSHRLPGIRFEARSPQLAEVLPRMDIAVFVGFASSGPFHIPVVIEDIAQFRMIFGDDVFLAWDKESGKQVYAYLTPAVRSFFSNGGRRCWVIRVADEETAKYNYFPIPGLAMAQFDKAGSCKITPAFAKARSEGSWSDSLSVSAILSTQPLAGKQFSFNEDQSVDCWISQSTKILPGDLLRLCFAEGRHIIMFYVASIDDLSSSDLLTSPPEPDLLHIKIFPERVLWFNTGPADSPPLFPAPLETVEILTFDLLARRKNEYPVRMQNMAFSRLNPRFWGSLPTDKELYEKRIIGPATDYTAIWREASDPRFPLAAEKQPAEEPRDVYYFPVGMQIMPEHFSKAEEQSEKPIVRDGLSEFSMKLFLDKDLMDIGTERLMSEADFLRYQSPKHRSLKGIHAAIDIEEATIIAVPDAIHRGWDLKEPEPQSAAIELSPPFRPEWWHHLECNLSYEEQKKRSEIHEFQVHKPSRENFLNCGIHVVPAPELHIEKMPDQTGTFTLEWISEVSNAKFILEESSFPNFAGPVEIYNGPQKSLTIYGRGYGSYYYRVCVVVNGNSSDWSKGIPVKIGPEKGLNLREVKDYSDSTLHTLLAVQRSLLRLSAARGDLFAVMALPEHYRDADAVAHIKKLKAGETRALSYSALYHPWLIVRTDDMPGDLQRIPSDGSACGILAKRALMRGAWIAPANELFSSVIALTPLMPQERWSNLQEAQVNLIRQEPSGFVSMSADTLSDDEDLKPINVRRLLILLRRLAMRLGAAYVFESNDEPFRRMLQRGFEAMLEQMFVRGAFAGNTPATSYQVVTDSSLNTPQSVDQGRFMVELRVAPSLPMTFITVRLIQTGGKVSVTEGH